MIFRKRHPPVGSRPGTLVVPAGAVPPRVRVIRYGPDRIEDVEAGSAETLRGTVQPESVTWIDVQGLGDEALLRGIGDAFGLHALALEDIVNAPQRPKAEEFPEHLLLVTRMARLAGEYLDVEQVAVVIGDGWLLSFQEQYGDVLDPVRRRLREGLGPMRRSGADYLGYAIVDTIVDAYYPIIELLSDRIERLEDRVMTTASKEILGHINAVRTDLVLLRRGVLPQREALGRLLREPSRFLSPDINPYLRDTYDHCDQLAEVIDSHRELVNGLTNTYLTLLSNRTNDVMRVLTIMASIFIPLTVLAGIYGMNFEYMPELRSRWAYPFLIGLMVILALGMLYFFRRRGWLGDLPEAPDGDT
jgi:magnesium transporter